MFLKRVFFLVIFLTTAIATYGGDNYVPQENVIFLEPNTTVVRLVSLPVYSAPLPILREQSISAEKKDDKQSSESILSPALTLNSKLRGKKNKNTRRKINQRVREAILKHENR